MVSASVTSYRNAVVVLLALSFALERAQAVSRRQLKQVARSLRLYLQHQRALGAPGSVPASAEARAAHEARLGERRARAIAELSATLRGETPRAPQAARPKPAPPEAPAVSTPSKPAQALASPPSRPTFDPDAAPKRPAAPPPPSSQQGAPLWKQLGARPQSIFRDQPAAAAPSTPAASSAKPSQTSEPERAPKEPPFKEVRRQDDRPLAARPESRAPSLFGESFEREARGLAAPIRGFDASPDQRKRLERMTHGEKLSFLRECLGDCTRCKLSQSRTSIVFGNGDPNAELIFIGEGPGYHEDQQGIPFVGKAGQLLNRMIFAMGLEREDVYISNVVKCRPPQNRDPAPDEIAACSPFLYKQLETLQPKAIVTLGRFASQCLLDTKRPMGKLRGSWQEWRQIPVMPTYHPAFLLRNPQSKRYAWEDLKLVMERLELPGR